MKKFTLLSMLALVLLSACAPSAGAIQTAIAQTQTAGGMPDKMSVAANQLIQEGTTLIAMTVQGSTFPEYRQQLARAKGAYSTALSAQSASRNISEEAVTELNQAFTAWDLALSVWDARENGGEAPHAPDAVRYPELVSYVGLEKLPMVGSGSESHVDQDKVLRILWYLAMDHFNAAQDLLLEQVQ